MHHLAVLVLILAACEARQSAPKPKPMAADAAGRLAPRPVVKRTKPRTEIRPALPPEPWTHAEAEQTADAWDAAAAAYQRELEACTATDDCLDDAYAIVLARKNGLMAEPIEPPPGDEPAPVPRRVLAVVDALDAYVAMADPLDPDLAGMKFLAASALYRWRQPDAIARLERVLREHRDDPTAEFAANQLLDLLMRAGRIAELRTWVDVLLGDEAFLAGKDALRETLERLRAM